MQLLCKQEIIIKQVTLLTQNHAEILPPAHYHPNPSPPPHLSLQEHI